MQSENWLLKFSEEAETELLKLKKFFLKIKRLAKMFRTVAKRQR